MFRDRIQMLQSLRETRGSVHHPEHRLHFGEAHYLSQRRDAMVGPAPNLVSCPPRLRLSTIQLVNVSFHASPQFLLRQQMRPSV